MRNRFPVCAALVLCSSMALAQDVSVPPVNTGGLSPASAGTAPLTAPSLLAPSMPSATSSTGAFDVPVMPGASSTTASGASSTEQKPSAAEDKESGFQLPGGSGYAPLDFTPGQGRFDRAPLSFSTTLQQGYDDNIYGSSGEPGSQPIKGSLSTTLSQGIDLLLSQSRFGLSMQANGGGQYYWDRSGDRLIPNGGLGLLFAYKLTPRAQFSSVINGSYTTQPSLSVINGLSQSNDGKGYLTANGKFDFLYQWAPRVSTDTSYSAAGVEYSGTSQSANNYLVQTLGQTLRYTIDPRVIGVFDVRASQTTHDNINSASDFDTYFVLAGFDFTVSRRIAASFRTGLTTQDYKTAGSGNSSSPYAEGSVDYTLTRNSALSFNGRYGFDTGGNTGAQSTKSTRVGMGYTQVFSSKLRGTVSVNYDHSGVSSAPGTTSSESQDAINGSIGVNYALTRRVNLFANATRFQVFATQPFLENARDTYYLGATYQY